MIHFVFALILAWQPDWYDLLRSPLLVLRTLWMLPSQVLAGNIPHWDDFSTVSALKWFLGAWRNISFPLKSKNLTRGCLHVRQSPSVFPWTQNFQADPCELNSVFSWKSSAILSLKKKILVLFVEFSTSGSLIIFLLQRSSRFLIHWWLTFVISLLFLLYPYSISTSKGGKKKASYLSLFPLSPVHNRCLVSNCRSNLHMTLSVRI